MYKLYVTCINGNPDAEGEYDGIIYTNKSDAMMALVIARSEHPLCTIVMEEC